MTQELYMCTYVNTCVDVLHNVRLIGIR